MSGGSRVLIPASLWKMIQDIKEIAGNHNDQDIYTMLKECNMDPNETAQKLLYLDTFHEVIKKRRRKLNVSRRSTEEYRWRGARGGQWNLSTHFSDDAGGRRTAVGPKEVGVSNQMERVSRSHALVHKMEMNTAANVSKSSTASMNGMASETNGTTSDGLFPKFSAVVAPESVVHKANLQSYCELNDPVFEGATPKLEMKLDISAPQSVIFPSQLNIPKSFKSGLTFGSLNGIFEEDELCNKGSVLEAASLQGNNEAVAELPLRLEVLWFHLHQFGSHILLLTSHMARTFPTFICPQMYTNF